MLIYSKNKDNAKSWIIKKNEFTIRIGDYEKYLYFIESGILRYWTAQEYGDPDKEVTFWFSFPGEFANSYFSLKENQPSIPAFITSGWCDKPR